MRPDGHYAVPPLDRMDVDELLTLIRPERYFVLHAPRQMGETSALFALRDLLRQTTRPPASAGFPEPYPSDLP